MGKGGTSLFIAGIITLGACTSSHRATTDAATTHSTTPNTTGRARERAGSVARERTRSKAATATTTPAAPVAPTGPGPAPDYSFDESVPPPALVNTGTDYVTILKSLESYGTWLGAHRPDPALALNTVAAGTPLLGRYQSDTRGLRDFHRRVVEKLNSPSTYKILSATATAFSARVVQDIAFDETVDPTGRVTSVARRAEPSTYIDIVVLNGGHWYLAASDREYPTGVHL